MMVPDDVRSAVARDLRPVRPLAVPERRVLSLMPIAVAVLLAAPMLLGLRLDAARLGWALTWGLSILEVALGGCLVAAALREAIPGRALSPGSLMGAFSLAATAPFVITVATFAASPTRIDPHAAGFVAAICFGLTIVTALPALLCSAFLVARAYPLRPAVAGALYGFGSGLMADAGWRMFCHYSGPGHVVPAHIGGVVAVAVLGSLLGLLGARQSAR